MTVSNVSGVTNTATSYANVIRSIKAVGANKNIPVQKKSMAVNALIHATKNKTPWMGTPQASRAIEMKSFIQAEQKVLPHYMPAVRAANKANLDKIMHTGFKHSKGGNIIPWAAAFLNPFVQADTFFDLLGGKVPSQILDMPIERGTLIPIGNYDTGTLGSTLPSGTNYIDTPFGTMEASPTSQLSGDIQNIFGSIPWWVWAAGAGFIALWIITRNKGGSVNPIAIITKGLK